MGQLLRYHVKVDGNLMKPNRDSILHIGPASSIQNSQLAEQYNECMSNQIITYNKTDLLVKAVHTPVWEMKFYNIDGKALDKDENEEVINDAVKGFLLNEHPQQHVHPATYKIFVRLLPVGSTPLPTPVLQPQPRDITGQ